MNIGKFVIFGTKDTNVDPNVVEPRAVGVTPSGGMKVWLDGMRNTLTVATSAIISSLPSIVVSTLPAVNPTMPTLLYQGLLSGSDATLYTAAANWRQIEIYLVNVDTVARTATLYLGNAGADANTIVKAVPLEIAGRVPVFVPSLASAAKINGLCDSANKVKIEIWGVSA